MKIAFINAVANHVYWYNKWESTEKNIIKNNIEKVFWQIQFEIILVILHKNRQVIIVYSKFTTR